MLRKFSPSWRPLAGGPGARTPARGSDSPQNTDLHSTVVFLLKCGCSWLSSYAPNNALLGSDTKLFCIAQTPGCWWEKLLHWLHLFLGKGFAFPWELGLGAGNSVHWPVLNVIFISSFSVAFSRWPRDLQQFLSKTWYTLSRVHVAAGPRNEEGLGSCYPDETTLFGFSANKKSGLLQSGQKELCTSLSRPGERGRMWLESADLS